MAKVMLSILSDTYEDDKISNLERAKDSAKVFEDFFTQELPEDQRFTLIRLHNPSASRCSRVFDQIVEQYGADTTLLILWTGHGILSPNGSEHLFLCSDADWTVKQGKSELGAIPDRLVKTKLGRFQGAVVEIQDDCRSDPERSRNGLVYKVDYVQRQRDNLRRDPTNKLARDKKRVRRGGRFHLWACDDGQSTGDNAVFANAFVRTAREQLRRAGSLVMNDDFVEALCENANFDEQTPVSGGKPIALVGDLPVGLEGERVGATDASRRSLAVWAIVVVAVVASLYAYLNRGANVSEADKSTVQTPTLSETEEPSETPGVISEQSAPPTVAEEAPTAEPTDGHGDGAETSEPSKISSGETKSQTEPPVVADDRKSATDEPPPTPPGVSDVGEFEALLTAGWDAYNNEKDYRTALANADAVLKEEPENPGAQDLSKRAKTGLSSQFVSQGRKELDSGNSLAALKTAVEAATYESTTESTNLRNAAKNAALSEAKKALEIGEYSEAKRLARAVLDAVKTDGYATVILNDAQKGLDKRNRVASLLSESRKLLAENKLDEALEKVEETLALDPYHAEAHRLKGEIENKIVDGKFDALLVEASSALENQDYDAAQSKLDAAKKLRPNHPDASNLENVIKTRRAASEVAKLVREGRDALQRGDLALARNKANAAALVDSENNDVKALLADVKKAEDQARIAAERKAAEDQALVATLLKDARSALNRGDNQWATEKANAVLGKDFASAEAKTEAKNILAEASKPPKNVWAESPSRKAGTRQTLKIGNAEYGFCWIPAGEFDMGSPISEQEEASANAKKYGFDWDFKEERQHHVKLTHGFWALETEVTQALYQEIMGENPSNFKGDDLPVETVSWDDAMKFCAELTKRLPKGVKASLPTEAQWEYACRAGTKTPYSFGSVLNGDKANCKGNYPYGTTTKGKYVGKTTPVKSYAPNGWGLYDVSGNVWEWCLDYFGDCPTGTVIDPKGPNSASNRVLRGGCWNRYAMYCRSAFRDGVSPVNRNCDLGFRFLLVCD